MTVIACRFVAYEGKTHTIQKVKGEEGFKILQLIGSANTVIWRRNMD